MRSIRRMIPVLVSLLSGWGCDWITSMGPQPKALVDSGYEARLNVFGVLRPAANDGASLSFVHVEYAHRTTEIPDSTAIADAEVTVYSLEGGIAVDSARFVYTPADSLFDEDEYREPGFSPEAGRAYGLSCRRGEYPEVTAATVMPGVPVILEGSLQADGGRLRFTILRDPSVVVYDVFFRVGDALFTQRLRQPEEGDTAVDLAFTGEGRAGGDLEIFAYDIHLSAYLAYNISIKPNTYRTDYSTVENGYGCFGSLNHLERVVVF